MSDQRLTSRGGKEKYIPKRIRSQNNVVPTQNNAIPLYDRPEAKSYLMTVESMLEKSTGTLQDSIWAPHNQAARQAFQQHSGNARSRPASQQHSSTAQSMHPSRQPFGPGQATQVSQQPSGPAQPRQPSQLHSATAQKMSPAAQIETSNPAPWGHSAWNTEAPKPTTMGQVKSSWESQSSRPANPSGELVASSWAVQQPQTANPKPEGMASITVKAGQQTSTVERNQFRFAAQKSYIPSHLRGIEPEQEWGVPPSTQAPVAAPVVAPKPASIQKTPATQDTDGEAWARKMGLLPKEPVTPAKAATDGNELAQKIDRLPETTTPATANTENEEWARKMGLLPKSAPAKQVPNAHQNSTSKVPQLNQPSGHGPKPVSNFGAVTQNKSSKVAQNAPFNNARFHLKQDSTEHFQQFVQSSTVTNGKKYTFNGPAPATAAEQQQNAPVGNGTTQPSGSLASVPQQQRGVPPQSANYGQQQQRGPPLQAAGPTQQPVHSNNENSAPFAKQDPNMMFSPSQMATAIPSIDKVAVNQITTDSPRVMKGPWPTMPSTNIKSFNEKVAHELNATKQVPANIAPLTQDALITTTGFLPRDHSLKFEDQVSDDGVVEENRKEGIRATQGMDAATQLLDWDKKRWAPPPCDWENDRTRFNDSFIPDYIKEWRGDIPCGPSIQVDTALDEFKGGKCPINNDVLIDPIEQPESSPDIGNGENEMKRLHQTSLVDANNFRAREGKKQRKVQSFRAAADNRHLEIAMAVDEPNPFSPKIDMYVRPAQQKDAQDIVKIYNYYVINSIIPEDQDPISLLDAQELIETAKREKLPFVVAVKGRVPPTHDAQGRTRSAKIILPQVESVLGFAFAERFNYAFSGSTRGRSRGTVTIQLYVDPTNTRKGVGRNTLDQLLHCMATAYSFKNACPWINPDNDPVHEANGCGLIHQMIMMVPVLKKDDPTFPWLSNFLYNKFWFKEENRMKSVARSSILHGTGRMLDIAVLQCELLHEGEFDAFS